MKELGLNEIREKFLNYFESKDHLVLKSFSLIPQDDDSLLLVNAGMASLKKYFTGEKKLSKDRATSSQRCIRTADIDEVGKTKRHGTFFEMLGNFSFGDYFKKEAISWAWDFLTNELELDKDVLWVSVYKDDDEAYNIWKDDIGVSEDRIVRLGREDNFWELEEGPCGPCSEIYVDRGYDLDPREDARPGDESDRFLEVWNLVFTQFNKTKEGEYQPLAHPNIDTGMGLERITMVLEGADNIFEINLVKDIISKIEELSGIQYNKDKDTDVSVRIIADHIRALTFLIYDGVIPSNEQRGYVLRRLIRRACRHGKLIGIEGKFLEELIDTCIEAYKSGYPELQDSRDRIVRIANAEETKFQETLDIGLLKLDQMLENNDSEVFSGEDAFKLYDTYGFPKELTVEIVEERGKKVDEEKFNQLMEEQRELARSSRNEDNFGWSGDRKNYGEGFEETVFSGYSHLKDEAKVLGIYTNCDKDTLKVGDSGIIILDRTPFYGEGGGQVGDKGYLYNQACKIRVYDTKKTSKKVYLHYVEVLEGELKLGDSLIAEVDIMRRRDIMKNHSATHLLHQALKDVVGKHVNQAGSYVDDERLRFDVTHFEAISPDQLKEVEKIVNDKIARGLPVRTDEMSLEDSQEIGAMGLFEDKYQDIVRVVQMGDYSKELCGGTHVKTTSDIQMFKIISESSVAAGVRRIEAITGRQVYKYLLDKENRVDQIKEAIKAKDENEIINRISSYIEENKDLKRKIKNIQQVDVDKDIDKIIDNAKAIDKYKIVTNSFEGLDNNMLRDIGEKIKSKIKDGLVILSNTGDDKLNFIGLASDSIIEAGVRADEIVRLVSQVTGGNGGGRKDFAQAGGKDLSKVSEALVKGEEKVIEILNS
ncbi:MAG: alanine--tRNA ligase [Finegoldia sp.]|nr:alanine--tRNA ligase [Finegoldia sp.]